MYVLDLLLFRRHCQGFGEIFSVFVSGLRLVNIFSTEYTIFCFVLARHDICINDFWENPERIPRKPRARKGGKIGTPIHFTLLARNKSEAWEKTHFLVVKRYEMRGNIEETSARHLSVQCIADFVCRWRFTEWIVCSNKSHSEERLQINSTDNRILLSHKFRLTLHPKASARCRQHILNHTKHFER